jgi:endoglucanase
MKKLCLILLTLLLAACNTNTAPVSNDVASQATPTPQAVLNKYYQNWKTNYLVQACGSSTQSRIHTDDAEFYTVSEGQGYGMLITVMLGDQTTFNKLYNYVTEHSSHINEDLMAAAQDENCDDVDGDDSATDGDLDIAYALLVASKKWGTRQLTGPVPNFNYRAEATRVISAIRASVIFLPGHPLEYMTKHGDWVSGGKFAKGSRTSDWMYSHFRAFSKFSKETNPSDTFWDKVLNKHYSVLAILQAQNPSTGLVSDFVVRQLVNGQYIWQPVNGKWLEGVQDGNYHYNACRNPWRIGTDAKLNNDTRAKEAAKKLNNWVRVASGGIAANIKSGYRLNGTSYSTGTSLCFTAPFIVPAYLAAKDTSNLNQAADQLWYGTLLNYLNMVDFNAVDSEGNLIEQYYGKTVALNSLIVVAERYRNY